MPSRSPPPRRSNPPSHLMHRAFHAPLAMLAVLVAGAGVSSRHVVLCISIMVLRLIVSAVVPWSLLAV